MSPSSLHPLPGRRLVLCTLAALAVAACGKQGADAGAGSKAPAEPAQVSLETIESQAKGFSVGPVMRAQTAYVFFDAQCPHCAALWTEVKPLAPRVRFVWIPVRLLGDKSLDQGAAILGAPDPVAAMEQHETSMRAQQGGIATTGVADAQKEAVKRNTELFTRYGFSGVPTIVAKHARTGETVVIDGALPAAQLAERIGL